jgi:mRNA interferase MazF
MSQKGTFNYIAPEVVAGRHYDATVDIYSLGLVLYKLLNNNRLPFIDANAKEVKYQDRKDAMDKRLNGAPLPPPAKANHSLAQVILKACAFNPKDRYAKPEYFAKVLELAKAGETIPIFEPTETINSDKAPVPMKRVPDSKPSAKKDPQKKVEQFGAKKKSKKPIIFAACFVLLAVIGVGVFLFRDTLLPSNPINQVIAALERQDTVTAMVIFAENRHEIDMAVFESALLRRTDALREEFVNEEVTLSAAQMEINTISNFNIEGLTPQINNVTGFINDLHNSRVVFELAETQYANNDYRSAIENFRLVSMDDANYSAALEGLMYFAGLNPVVGSEQGETRPVLVVHNNIGNKHSPTVVVVPITCRLKKNRLPTHVNIPQISGLATNSLALVEQIRTIDRIRLREYIGCIEENIQSEIDTALAICVGIHESVSEL